MCHYAKYTWSPVVPNMLPKVQKLWSCMPQNSPFYYVYSKFFHSLWG